MEAALKAIAEFVAESQQARRDHAAKHAEEAERQTAESLRHTEDHRRLHTRITDEVGTAIKASELVAQSIRDARMMGKGAWFIACSIGAGMLMILQWVVDFFAKRGHP